MGPSIARNLCCGLILAIGLSAVVHAAPVASAAKPISTHTRGVIIVPADAPEGGGGDAKPDAAQKTITPVNHSVLRHCDLPHEKWDLAYSGQSDFDHNLSGTLKLGKPVVVNLAEPYDENSAPPAALGSWISEVKGAGGQVTMSAYCNASRGVGQGWFSNFIQHLTGSIYKPARNYDVTIFADQTRHKVTQIAFLPKSGPKAASDSK